MAAPRRRSLVAREPDVALPPMPLGEEVINDYRFLRLSLRAHPAQFLRADLDARRCLRNEALRGIANDTRVRISGLVTCRQRPGSAKGVVFMTIEDESAVANVIVWPRTFERVRPVVLGARYVLVSGRVQAEAGVIHVVAEQLEDLTPWLARLADHGGDIDGSGALRRGAPADRGSARGERTRRPAQSSAGADARNAGARLRSRRAGARLGARAERGGRADYCGTTPPRPTLTRLASSEPSGFFSARIMATWAPAFSSLLSPTA